MQEGLTAIYKQGLYELFMMLERKLNWVQIDNEGWVYQCSLSYLLACQSRFSRIPVATWPKQQEFIFSQF